MEIKFRNLTFNVVDDKIGLSKFGKFESVTPETFVEVQVTGENKPTHAGVKMMASSEGKRLKYVSHEMDGCELSVVQQSEIIRTKTFFTAYDDSNAVRIRTEITNISEEEVIIEEASAFVFYGLTGRSASNIDGMYFTKFIQGHHAECQPLRLSFREYGFFGDAKQPYSQKRIAHANVGSWSTKEALPQGIIENTEINQMMMFQIESNASWYYEIAENRTDMYLYLGGPNASFGGWSKKLMPGETYCTRNVAISLGETLNEVLGEMTKYRRHICGLSEIDKNLPSIFNEYMHLSWDSPTEETTKIYAPIVAKTGAEYYVIDCGWHNEEPGDKIYPYVGQWKESKVRFPGGVRKTTDYIRTLGMKAGLWIEPEVVGMHCDEMLQYYDDDCFLQRHGKKIVHARRYFLDYRNPKVVEYMTETIRRMVEDYGADYIKFDYNQDVGVGTDLDCIEPGEGLELCSIAFLEWVNSMKQRFPNVVFEGCASGGLRMDYKSLSVFSLVSTSDQIDYLKYPYIAGNILSSVLPEQAAVWSYPVGECSKEEINDDQIIMNMINSFLGRMHLASHLEWMNASQLKLVADGVELYNSLSEKKHMSVPYLPIGFTHFGDKVVASGFKCDDEVYLAVWNLSDVNHIEIPFDSEIVDALLAYPCEANAKFSTKEKKLCVDFDREKTAAFFKVTLQH